MLPMNVFFAKLQSDKKKCIMETIDRSPSQNPDEFKSSFQILTLT